MFNCNLGGWLFLLIAVYSLVSSNILSKLHETVKYYVSEMNSGSEHLKLATAEMQLIFKIKSNVFVSMVFKGKK